MRRSALVTTAVALPLALAACGTATSSSSGDSGGSASGGGSGSHTTPPPSSANAYAAGLLAAVRVPAGARPSPHAPTKALEGLPVGEPSLTAKPLVLTRYWTTRQSPGAVLGWLKAHGVESSRLAQNGSGSTGGSGGPVTSFLAYQSRTLPVSIAVGDLYLAVAPSGGGGAAIGAYAVSMAQPPRPAAERVPVSGTKVLVGWQLAPGGTPVRKELTGAPAERMVRLFDGLRVSTTGAVPCPMMPTQYGDIIVTFTAQGHTWRADIPACPAIRVTRDHHALPALVFGKAFLADVKRYTGQLPHAGPQRPGGVTPLMQQSGSH